MTLFIHCPLAQPYLSWRHSAPARLVPYWPLSTPCSCQPAGLSTCRASLSQTLTGILAPSASSPNQARPYHSFPASCSVSSLRPSQPLCGPITSFLPSISFALDTSFCILLGNHRLPCTLNYLVGVHFLSPSVCSGKELWLIKCTCHRIGCFRKY